MKLKPLLQNLALLFAALLVIALVLEAGIRIFSPEPCNAGVRGLYVGSDSRCYGLQPDAEITVKQPEFTMHIKTNSDGFRDREFGPKDESIFRIFAVGDSIQLGGEVTPERTYIKQLERRLNLSAHGKNAMQFEVVNAAVGGYSTYQELALLNESIAKYAPDAILASFYLGNDFTDNVRGNTCKHAVKDGYLVTKSAVESSTFAFNARVFLNSHSQLYCFAKNRAVNLPGVGARLYTDESFISVAEFGRTPLSTKSEEAVNKTYDALAGMAAVARSRNISLIIVAVPSKLQLSFGQWDAVVASLNDAEGNYSVLKPSETIRRFASELGALFIDTLPYLAAGNASNAKFYFSRDIHLTPEGHDAVAKAVYENLQESQVFSK